MKRGLPDLHGAEREPGEKSVSRGKHWGRGKWDGGEKNSGILLEVLEKFMRDIGGENFSEKGRKGGLQMDKAVDGELGNSERQGVGTSFLQPKNREKKGDMSIQLAGGNNLGKTKGRGRKEH